MGTFGKARLLSWGAIASAIAASICCFGPLVLALLGLGGGALLLTLEPFRPYSLAAGALSVGAAFYFADGPRAEQACAADSACARPPSRRRQRIVLWIAAAIVALAAAFPYVSRWLF